LVRKDDVTDSRAIDKEPLSSTLPWAEVLSFSSGKMDQVNLLVHIPQVRR